MPRQCLAARCGLLSQEWLCVKCPLKADTVSPSPRSDLPAESGVVTEERGIANDGRDL